MNAADVLSRGYFPRELPPPFHSETFGRFVTTSPGRPVDYAVNGPSKRPITMCAVHNLARAGSLRRRLSIPNPIAYDGLAHILSQNWSVLLPCTAGSPISLTTPKATPGKGRAIVPTVSFPERVHHRARIRAGKRYLLQTDIANFYHSAYTHSIAWAIHGKAVAKKNRGSALIGNLIDAVVRNGQDQQTVGIPIGPDSSLLIAEILLTSIDKAMPPAMSSCIRYVDDYEFGCTTYAEAESCLSTLQERLSELELQLNPRKTIIRPLPLPLEGFWAPELRLYQIRSNAAAQATDLLSFFGKVFQIQPSCPEDSILKYAVSRTRSETVHSDNWPLYEALLLQAATVEPGTLPIVTELFARYSRAGYKLDFSRIAEVLNRLIEVHCGIGHGSEVAWAVWGFIELGCKIGKPAAKQLSASDDPVVALVVLDARARGLVDPALDTSRWESLITPAELHGSSWLLTYESFLKGWLPGVAGVDPIASEPYFSWLRKGNVSFYDVTRQVPVRIVALPVSRVIAVGEGPVAEAEDIAPELWYD